MNLEKLENESLESISQAADIAELEALETDILGRKGKLTSLLRELGKMSEVERKAAGQKTNQLKNKLLEAFESKRHEFEKVVAEKAALEESLDVTEPVNSFVVGKLHPITQETYKLTEIFARLGFTAVDGPEIESEVYNFDSLNMPSWHPARDMQDTFFLEGGLVMRTHTSPVQVRAMRTLGAPLAIIVPGRAYRNEATDASHDYLFDQIEGLLISEDVSLAHMATVFKSFLKAYFGREVPMRLRPGYFPFVEPGLELELGCQVCQGRGCRVCKNRGWMELMGCGMVHREVLEAGGINPKQYRGFAFGFGLTRLIMQQYQLSDIRLLHSTDVRFLSQF
jgi:phenylalanyl-tRNA synthetase alpha chain